MHRSLYFAFVLLLVASSRVDAVQELEDDNVLCECKALRDQVKGLQKNITELWTYVFQLRNAMAAQLKHLKEHQVQTEMTLEHMAHHSGHGADSYHKQERQESHDHDHDHYAEESSHHGDHEHHHHHEESSHHEDHDKHGDDSSHHGDHDDHHHHDDHHDDHHHHDDDHSQGSSSHSHSHEETDHHHQHHDDSHEHTSKEKKEEVAEEVIVATTVDQHRHHGHVHEMRSLTHSHGHHSHHDHGSHTNKTVFPMTSEYDQYKFATCAVESNKALPAEAQQDVRGEVTFWQLKTGGPLGIHVRLQGFKMGAHHGQHHQTNEQEEQQQVEVPVANQVTMVHKHGLHVHSEGDMSNGCQSMGPHYNPHGVDHKGPTSPLRHVGDLGNIECDDHGFTNIAFSDSVASLIGPYSVLNRGLVVHADPDDYGKNLDDPESLKTGNAGQRIACCIIQEVERPSFKAYRYSKRAKQYQNR